MARSFRKEIESVEESRTCLRETCHRNFPSDLLSHSVSLSFFGRRHERARQGLSSSFLEIFLMNMREKVKLELVEDANECSIGE